ncbi:MAG: single-stranded DNA-binding protein [Candidatus Peribacteraceae bacterium]|nr:single-stranded DNA-binding protein [Candidatus Peribacteraceae bacterium]
MPPVFLFPISSMFNVNRVTLLGHATRDAEVRATKAGHPVAHVGLATNRSWKDAAGKLQEEVEFHNLVCFNPLADFAGKTVSKGAPLYVEGHLHTSKWEKDGKKASRTEIYVDRLVLLSARKGAAIAAEVAAAA